MAHFTQANIETFIENYHASPQTESKTEGAQVKLTATQKAALQHICRENDIGMSTFISHALDAYIEMFPYREKIVRHREFLVESLKRLS